MLRGGLQSVWAEVNRILHHRGFTQCAPEAGRSTPRWRPKSVTTQSLPADAMLHARRIFANFECANAGTSVTTLRARLNKQLLHAKHHVGSTKPFQGATIGEVLDLADEFLLRMDMLGPDVFPLFVHSDGQARAEARCGRPAIWAQAEYRPGALVLRRARTQVPGPSQEHFDLDDHNVIHIACRNHSLLSLSPKPQCLSEIVGPDSKTSHCLPPTTHSTCMYRRSSISSRKVSTSSQSSCSKSKISCR